MTYFKASSSLLMQSSDYFKARLGPNWPEGQELTRKGSVTTHIEGFDREGDFESMEGSNWTLQLRKSPFQALSQVFPNIKFHVRNATDTLILDQINANFEWFHDDLITNTGKQVIPKLRELPREGYSCYSLRLGFWAKGKRSSMSSKNKDDDLTTRSISRLIHKLSHNAKHTCTEGRWGNCPNFQQLLGEGLLTQLKEASYWVSYIEEMGKKSFIRRVSTIFTGIEVRRETRLSRMTSPSTDGNSYYYL